MDATPSPTENGPVATLVRSKLDPGRPPDFAVERPRLHRRLDEAVRSQPLTLVTAPGGYGKSVLLRQWAATTEPVAWLTLDPRDRDPVRVARHLLGALEPVVPGVGAGARRDGPSPGLGDELVDRLLDHVGRAGRPVVLVLEDVDHIDATSALEQVARLVVEAPPDLHVVVACRADPDLPLARLRSAGRLGELRARDLTFTVDEVGAVITSLSGHSLAVDEADHLQQVTEGWPVAVQLAALSLRGEPDPSDLSRFGPGDRAIVDYLSAEVLARLRPDLRAFLLDVSVLEELRGDLCDAATGRTDSARLLEDLRQDDVFVVPVGSPGSYRLHRLVRELLRLDLLADAPERPALIRRRAAAWCVEHGDLGQAADHLVAAEAWDDLLPLLYDHSRTMWEQGEMESLLPWIEAIPLPIRREHPRLRLTEAAIHLLVGRPEATAAVIAAMEDGGGVTPGEQAVADFLVLGLVEDAPPRPEVLERGSRALALLDETPDEEVPRVIGGTDPLSLRAMIPVFSTKVRLLLGAEGTLDSARQGADMPIEAAPIFQVHGHGTLGLVEAVAHLPGAEASARRSIELAEHQLGVRSPAPATAEVALAIVHRERGELDLAVERLDAAIAHTTRWGRWPLAGLAVVERALVDLAAGRPDDALAHLARGSALTAVPPAPFVDDRHRAVELLARRALGTGDPETPAPTRPPVTAELALVRVGLAVADSDPGRARRLLDEWPTKIDPLGAFERALAEALVERAVGSVADARRRVEALLASTAPARLVGPYVLGGPAVTALLADLGAGRPSGHAAAVVAAVARAGGRRVDLADPLSAREVEVLQLLPTRMTNADIAAELFVSTNTVKTHLKHIYQKLGATDRDEAVRHARDLHLLD